MDAVVAIDWNKVIEQSLAATPPILMGAAAVIVAVRRKFKAVDDKQNQQLENQRLLVEKVDGNHARVLEEVKKAGKYEGVQEAKGDARFDQEQILKAMEQALTAAAQRRGKRKTDPP